MAYEVEFSDKVILGKDDSVHDYMSIVVHREGGDILLSIHGNSLYGRILQITESNWGKLKETTDRLFEEAKRHRPMNFEK